MRIHLPAETWEEILNWLDRKKFVKKMEQLWDREFSQIAANWLHEWSRNNKIDAVLKFVKSKDGDQAEFYKYYERRNQWKTVPIAEVEIPKNICSFKQIRISYLDSTVLAFLRNMQPLLRHNKVHLSIDSFHEKECQIALDHLLPLFNDGEFESVKLVSQHDVKLLNDNHYASTLLNTKSLIVKQTAVFDWWFELLANWLFTKRADGQPRMLALPYHTDYQDFIKIIQERFMAVTTEAFPFMVRFEQNFNSSFVEETIKNDGNGQQLIMRKISDYQRNMPETHILIVSCPMEVNQELLAKWEQKMLMIYSGSSAGIERDFQLFLPIIGNLFNQIDQKQQQSTSSLKATNKSTTKEKPGMHSIGLKRNAQKRGKKKPIIIVNSAEKKRKPGRID